MVHYLDIAPVEFGGMPCAFQEVHRTLRLEIRHLAANTSAIVAQLVAAAAMN